MKFLVKYYRYIIITQNTRTLGDTILHTKECDLKTVPTNNN